MSRQVKWNWSSHTSRMIELYNTGMSIPDIHKAIQCEGFEPCQRSVYMKFKTMGYPTDPVGRSRLNDVYFPPSLQSNIQNMAGALSSRQTPANQHIGSELYALPGENNLGDPTHPYLDTSGIGSSALEPVLEEVQMTGKVSGRGAQQELGSLSRNKLINSTDVGGLNIASPWSPPHTSLGSQGWASTFDVLSDFQNSSMELNGAAYFSIDTGSNDLPVSGNNDQYSLSNFNDTNYDWNGDALLESSRRSFSSMDLDDPTAPTEHIERHQQRTSFNEVRIPFPDRINNFSSATGARTKLRSLFRPKSSGSSQKKKGYTISQYTRNTEDSGYASGYTSCLTLDDIQQVHPQSLSEFNGLYRVACQNLHEPQSIAKFRDIPTCKYCRYSGIHNLGWSARYLKFEVFLSELRLIGVYEFSALDAAGNTALHYAAAGGANFLHLKALIDVGVDPYVQNTAGELFIHCLRPIQPFTLEPNSDCLKGDDLLRLLELLQAEKVFGVRDNNGQTILHALALKIAEPELKAKIFTLYTNSGYYSTLPDRFGNTPHDVIPLTYDCHGQVIDPTPFSSYQQTSQASTTSSRPIFPGWELSRVKQIKSQSVLLEARRNPRYIDPVTGDNVLHALSRLKSSNDTLLSLEHFNSLDSTNKIPNREGNQILLNIEYFIQSKIDLNLHNKEGSHPLKSFICDRPAEEIETGATRSKYLDAILWKNCNERIGNDVIVNMKDRDGATALHNAAVRGRPDSVRSLIAAGANFNARSDDGVSVLQATFDALDAAEKNGGNDGVLVHLIKEVIAHLEHAGAVQNPTSLQERGVKKP